MAWRALRYRSRVAARLAGLRRDPRGVAVVEFALVLPLMLMLYVSATALTEAVTASRATITLARTLTDLTSQQKGNTPLTDTLAQAIFNASTVVMAPFPTASLKMTLSNVEFYANAASVSSNLLDAKTRWSVTFSGGTLRPCNTVLTPAPNGSTPSPSTIPLGLYASGFLIVADVNYVYTPTFGYLNYTAATGKAARSILSFTMAHTTYMRPRQTDNIKYTSGQSATICTVTSPPQQA